MRRGKERGKRVCRCAFVGSISVLCVCEGERETVWVCVCVFVCIGGAVQPGCRYHPSPCHRPKGCWESGRQLPGSDNGGCILISQHRMHEKPALLLPHHHPVWKTINPAICKQSTELSPGHRWLRLISAPIIQQHGSEQQHFA